MSLQRAAGVGVRLCVVLSVRDEQTEALLGPFQKALGDTSLPEMQKVHACIVQKLAPAQKKTQKYLPDLPLFPSLFRVQLADRYAHNCVRKSNPDPDSDRADHLMAGCIIQPSLNLRSIQI